MSYHWCEGILSWVTRFQDAKAHGDHRLVDTHFLFFSDGVESDCFTCSGSLAKLKHTQLTYEWLAPVLPPKELGGGREKLLGTGA